MSLLSVDSLSYQNGRGETLIRDLSFQLNSGGTVQIGGPNGVGKSTLIRALLGRWRSIGSIQWDIPLKQVGLLPQLENTDVLLPLSLEDVLTIGLGHQLDLNAITSVGLLEEKDLRRNWNTASGGERKRTLLTRLLLQNPKVLILDEPLNHLDHRSRDVVREKLVAFAKEDRGVIVVTHAPFPADAQVTKLDLGEYAP